MGENQKRNVLSFIDPIKFQRWDRPKQWALVDAKKELATKVLEKVVTTDSRIGDQRLWRKLNRHARFYESIIRSQDKLAYKERWALIRAGRDPCQQTLTHGLPMRLATGKWPTERNK